MDKIEKAARREARANEALYTIAQVAQTIVIPALIGILAWYKDKLIAIGVEFVVIVLILLAIVQIALFLATKSAKQTVQALYFNAKDISKRLDDATVELEARQSRTELFIFIEKLASVYANVLLLYGSRKIDTLIVLKEVMNDILSPVVLNGEKIFAFGPGEKWNFVVYLYRSRDDRLVPVWREKSQVHPSKSMGRSWRRGQGHVGYAFANARAIVTENARGNDVQNLISAVPGQKQDYDDATYISFASIPIGPVENQAEPIGVLVATSDRVGRFTTDNSRIFHHASLCLANILVLANVDLVTIVDSLPDSAGEAS